MCDTSMPKQMLECMSVCKCDHTPFIDRSDNHKVRGSNLTPTNFLSTIKTSKLVMDITFIGKFCNTLMINLR